MSSILVIDDDESIRLAISEIVRKMGHKAFSAPNGEEGVNLFRDHDVDLVITDLKMAPVDGFEVLKRVKELDAGALVMMITAYADVDRAVEAMKLGACDFVQKGSGNMLEVLRQKINEKVSHIAQRHENERLRERHRVVAEDARDASGVREMKGNSPKMAQIWNLLKKVAVTDSSVLITGESGTGKELVARAIHDLSNRASGPFIKVSCGALAETLLESELFGHEKGSFTGAIRRKLGRFELADGGTIFLDEIGDISPSIQLKLLRVLQEREFERVGGEETLKVDVRCVSATNKNLLEEISRGRFREDLYYRLHIVPVTLPPLRERKEDIALLVAHFLDKLKTRTGCRVSGISDAALARLQQHDWPGNVRELENVIEQAMVFAEGEKIDVGDLPRSIGATPVMITPGAGGQLSEIAIPDGDIALDPILEDTERKLIQAAYDRAGGVKAECARILGIKTSALYYKLEKYRIGGKD